MLIIEVSFVPFKVRRGLVHQGNFIILVDEDPDVFDEDVMTKNSHHLIREQRKVADLVQNERIVIVCFNRFPFFKQKHRVKILGF